MAFDGLDVAVPHDPGRAATGVHPEQVLGVGAASLTLAAATPRANVHRALDLGTGCGIQALLADDHADVVLATGTRPLGALLAVLRRAPACPTAKAPGRCSPSSAGSSSRGSWSPEPGRPGSSRDGIMGGSVGVERYGGTYRLAGATACPTPAARR